MAEDQGDGSSKHKITRRKFLETAVATAYGLSGADNVLRHLPQRPDTAGRTRREDTEQSGKSELSPEDTSILSEALLRGEISTSEERAALCAYANRLPEYIDSGVDILQFSAGSRQFLLLPVGESAPRRGERMVSEVNHDRAYSLIITADNGNPLVPVLLETQELGRLNPDTYVFNVTADLLRDAANSLKKPLFYLAEDEPVNFRYQAGTGDVSAKNGISGELYQRVKPNLQGSMVGRLGIVDGHLQGYNPPDSFSANIKIDIFGGTPADWEAKLFLHCQGGGSASGADVILSAHMGGTGIGISVDRRGDLHHEGSPYREVAEEPEYSDEATGIIMTLEEKKAALINAALQAAVLPPMARTRPI